MNEIREGWMKYEDGIWGKEYRCKNSKNQTVRMEFSEWVMAKKTRWYVCLTVKTKKKTAYRDIYKKQTGDKTGIENLLIAKEMMRRFINDLEKGRHIIYIQWDDTHRRNVYERGLKEFGFKLGFREGSECLFLDVEAT